LSVVFRKIGSEKIRKALTEIDLKADQLMIDYKGVRFDNTGQNIMASTFQIQLKGKEYVSVWPEKSRDRQARTADEGLAIKRAVMAGPVPAIHVFSWSDKDVDAGDKRGHDESIKLRRTFTAAEPTSRRDGRCASGSCALGNHRFESSAFSSAVAP